eukprot:8528231-Pyramimonas_sp.AAC.1
MQLHGQELRGVFFTEFYADVEPPDDGSTLARQAIASKTTCALDAPPTRPIQRAAAGPQRVLPAGLAVEWTERDMAAGAPNPFLISKSSPHVWPPAPGARVPGADRSCPAGIALVHYDAKKNGPFHDAADAVARPCRGQAYYRADRTTRKAQFNGVNAAMREFFSIGCNRAALWGTALPPIVWTL